MPETLLLNGPVFGDGVKVCKVKGFFRWWVALHRQNSADATRRTWRATSVGSCCVDGPRCSPAATRRSRPWPAVAFRISGRSGTRPGTCPREGRPRRRSWPGPGALDAPGLEFRRDDVGGARFLESQLQVGMDVPPPRRHVLVHGVERRGKTVSGSHARVPGREGQAAIVPSRWPRRSGACWPCPPPASWAGLTARPRSD